MSLRRRRDPQVQTRTVYLVDTDALPAPVRRQPSPMKCAIAVNSDRITHDDGPIATLMLDEWAARSMRRTLDRAIGDLWPDYPEDAP